MQARMEEKGPGGVPHGWSLLSCHTGDIPESVAGPANVGFGGGGRKTHWELMQRSRHEEHRNAKLSKITDWQENQAAFEKSSNADVTIEGLSHAGGGQGVVAAGLVSQEFAESGDTGPEHSDPSAAVLDAVVIEGLEEK